MALSYHTGGDSSVPGLVGSQTKSLLAAEVISTVEGGDVFGTVVAGTAVVGS